MSRDATLVVSATFDGSHPDWYDRLPNPKVRVSTAAGGHPSQAFINAFRDDRHRHRAYLFLQDTLEPLDANPAALFEQASVDMRSPVIGWARFPMFFDSPEQELRVTQQYPYVPKPDWGIFGPIFWAERKVMERLEKYGRFPKAPEDKLHAQGTERAWAYALAAVGVQPRFIHDWSNDFLASGDAIPFRKVFAGRQ